MENLWPPASNQFCDFRGYILHINTSTGGVDSFHFRLCCHCETTPKQGADSLVLFDCTVSPRIYSHYGRFQ